MVCPDLFIFVPICNLTIIDFFIIFLSYLISFCENISYRACLVPFINTSRENLFCGAPKYAFCGAWVVLHRIFATKISILWRTNTCAIEIRNSVAHQALMRHRIPYFCGALWFSAPQN
jgi:hypothetical protein